MQRMYEKGLVTEGSMLEFAHMHAAVVYQPGFSEKHFSGLNPYALGYAMMRDIKRICLEPTAEDEAWFPDFAGNRDYMGVLRQAWADFRDESFIHQYLSPNVMREMRLFQLKDEGEKPAVRVEAIHDEQGYKQVRRMLARQYDVSQQDPDIQVTDADLAGSRRLVMTHFVRNGILLDKDECDRTLMHVARLWGYRVRLIEVDATSGKKLREHETLPLP
jgi:spore cortex formation protein SpoVR/YcgB (stage V sporulation)